MANQYNVNIAGYGLVVQTVRSEAYVRQLEGALNEKVREIQKTGGTANYLNVVMLTAMELADDVLTTKELVARVRKENRELEKKTLRLEEETNGLKERLQEIEKEFFALQAEAEVLRKEREKTLEKSERRNRDLLEVLDNALK